MAGFSQHITSIPELIGSNAKATPDAIALLDTKGNCWSYAQLQSRIAGIVTLLRAGGIRQQDRVVTVLPNGIEAAVGFLATSSCAVAVPLNPNLSHNDFTFYLTDLQPSLFLMSPGCDSAAIAAASQFGLKTLELPAMDTPPLEFREDDAMLLACSPEPEDTALILYTSGTTSQPKRVPLQQAQLIASAKNIANTLDLAKGDRCLNVMPLFHIHGLIAGLLASLASGGSVACSPGFDGSRFLDWLDDLTPSWYTAVPTIHQSFLSILNERSSPGRIPHSLRFIRSSSSAMPLRVMAELEERMGVPLIEAYGMTEATHQIASNPLPPGIRKPGSVGSPVGVEVTVLDSQDAPLPVNTVGEIALQGTTITTGYENNSEANASAFCNGWFRTGDEGTIDKDGYIFLTGRVKEMINRGGEKIVPIDIDNALMEHTAVAQAVAFAVSHPSMGEDVAAAVVLKQGEIATEGMLRAHLLERISEYKVPSRIVFVLTIPKGPTGKLQRIGLAEILKSQMTTEYSPPSIPLEAELGEIWSEVLGVNQVGRNDNFFALGGDSLSAARILSRVQHRLAVRMGLRQMFEAPTLKDQTQGILKALVELDKPGTKTAGKTI